MAYYSLERAAPTTNDASHARQRTPRALVSGNLFSVLGGVVPLHGRLLTPADEEHREPVVVISYSAWQKWFNGAPDVVGKTITDDQRCLTRTSTNATRVGLGQSLLRARWRGAGERSSAHAG
jgi:hypothetical protein